MPSISAFRAEESCREALRDARWPKGVECPKCGKQEKVYALKSKPFYWLCKNCKSYRFSVISGTIFENTKKPLKVWFKVAYLMLVAKKGRSALEIHRTMYGDPFTADYHTTWYMCTRLRAAMRNQTWTQLMGEVEVDETYIGGANRNRHASMKKKGKGTANKVAVIGAIARKGNIVCQVIENADTETLTKFVRKTVDSRVDLLATDEHSGYRYLKWAPYPHETIAHSTGELRARQSSYADNRKLLVSSKTRHHGQLSQSQRALSAAVPRRIYVPVQQSKESGHVRRATFALLANR